MTKRKTARKTARPCSLLLLCLGMGAAVLTLLARLRQLSRGLPARPRPFSLRSRRRARDGFETPQARQNAGAKNAPNGFPCSRGSKPHETRESQTLSVTFEKARSKLIVANFARGDICKSIKLSLETIWAVVGGCGHRCRMPTGAGGAQSFWLRGGRQNVVSRAVLRPVRSSG